MAQLDKNDLAQMNHDYFRSLKKEQLVEVADNLHRLAVDQLEKLEQNSHNSSKPPSSDNPYFPPNASGAGEGEETTQGVKAKQKKKKGFAPKDDDQEKPPKRKPGKQPGTPGQWRSMPLEAQILIPHHPEHCAACGQLLSSSAPKPCRGHYALELEPGKAGLVIACQLHHYYQGTCACGHVSQAKPGEGYVSEVEGRGRDLKLTEAVLVAPQLTTFIAALGVRYRLSRAKIREWLWDWAGTELSVGTIDRCIREAGIACVPIVEELVKQLQQADLLHTR